MDAELARGEPHVTGAAQRGEELVVLEPLAAGEEARHRGWLARKILHCNPLLFRGAPVKLLRLQLKCHTHGALVAIVTNRDLSTGRPLLASRQAGSSVRRSMSGIQGVSS
jgi:hypothetical protein